MNQRGIAHCQYDVAMSTDQDSRNRSEMDCVASGLITQVKDFPQRNRVSVPSSSSGSVSAQEAASMTQKRDRTTLKEPFLPLII